MYKSYYISNVYRLKKQTEKRIKAVMVIINLQDFNTVKRKSRPQTLSIRQAFLNGGENHSGMLMLGSRVRIPPGSLFSFHSQSICRLFHCCFVCFIS